jgi:hypothetical protein
MYNATVSLYVQICIVISHINESENLPYCTMYLNDLRDKIGKIRKWQQRFVEEFNGRKQESVPQKVTKHKHAPLHAV